MMAKRPIAGPADLKVRVSIDDDPEALYHAWMRGNVFRGYIAKRSRNGGMKRTFYAVSRGSPITAGRDLVHFFAIDPRDKRRLKTRVTLVLSVPATL